MPRDPFVSAQKKEWFTDSTGSSKQAIYPLNGKLYCPNMKKTTLESVKRALLEKDESIEIPEIYQEKALLSIERMLENS